KGDTPMKRVVLLLSASVLLLLSLSIQSRPPKPPVEEANTFSIAAYDPERKEWGVAVASKYLAVGSAVPWAKAGVGAVATQAAVNVTLGPQGLEMLEKGKSAEETVKALMEGDNGRTFRQIGL